MTLFSLCNSPLDLERVAEMEFGTVITYLELLKAQQETEWISNELEKNKLKIK